MRLLKGLLAATSRNKKNEKVRDGIRTEIIDDLIRKDMKM